VRVREILRAAPQFPAGKRLKLARKLIAYSGQPCRPSTPETCVIESPTEFEAGRARLTAMLGRGGSTPAGGYADFFEFVAQHRRPFLGVIGASDYLFITAFVSVLAPERVIELGTLTGFSAAVLAAAIIRERGYHGRAVVDTIDRMVECAVAPEPVGFEIPQILPQWPEAVRIHAGRDSRIVRHIAAPDELELVLIDASHKHPWPLLDVLRVAQVVRGGGWVILHDIQLGTMGVEQRKRGESSQHGFDFGAEWLFDAWPFRKISGGNIGAVQIPELKSAVLPLFACMMRKPFETAPSKERELRRWLYQALGELV
jgi:hypothetical protein